MSNEYGYQSYLYPAGSAASGGGAGSGTGTAGAVVGVSVGARTLMFPKYQHKYVPRPSAMKNNEWYTIKFDSAFDSIAEIVHLQVTPIMSGYRSFLVNNVTTEGFDIMCNYVPEFVGLYYTAYADVLG